MDILVIDLPPGTGDIQLTLVRTSRCYGCDYCHDATGSRHRRYYQSCEYVSKWMVLAFRFLGIVENMSWFTPVELKAIDRKFGKRRCQKLASLCHHTNLLGQIPLIMSVREGGDTGKPIALNDDREEITEQFKILTKNVMDWIESSKRKVSSTQKVMVQS